MRVRGAGLVPEAYTRPAQELHAARGWWAGPFPVPSRPGCRLIQSGRRMLKMPVMHKLDCRISDPSSYWGELGPREYVRRYYGGTGECEVEVVVL